MVVYANLSIQAKCFLIFVGALRFWRGQRGAETKNKVLLGLLIVEVVVCRVVVAIRNRDLS